MLSITDTTLDLLVLQFVLHVSGFGLFLFRILAPVRGGLEDDVLADGSCVIGWSCFVRGR